MKIKSLQETIRRNFINIVAKRLLRLDRFINDFKIFKVASGAERSGRPVEAPYQKKKLKRHMICSYVIEDWKCLRLLVLWKFRLNRLTHFLTMKICPQNRCRHCIQSSKIEIVLCVPTCPKSTNTPELQKRLPVSQY